jgi:transposase
LAAVDQVTAWVDGEPAAAHPAVQDGLATVVQVRAQDVVEVPGQPATLRQGVAVDRRISISDPQMRHGRKSRAVRVDGYKRHLVRDLDSEGLIVAVGLTAANAPEASVTPDLEADLVRQGRVLRELHIDRAYLSSHWVRDRQPEVTVRAKAWPATNRGRYPKTAFRWDWTEQTVTCPAGAVAAFTPGAVTRFGAARCRGCPQRTACTTSAAGRSVSVHPDERLLSELRTAQQTPAGRAVLRERVAVEHSLAHIGQWQGDRARYRGIRKNLFDLRRVAAVNNLHVLARRPQRSIAA